MLKRTPVVCRQSGGSLEKAVPAALTLVMTLLLASVQAWAQAGMQAAADNISYNVGETVRLKVVYLHPQRRPRPWR